MIETNKFDSLNDDFINTVNGINNKFRIIIELKICKL